MSPLRIERPPKLHDLVAQRMQELMFSGKWELHSRLPTEGELCDRFGVSRTVVREAIRVLATRGLVTEGPGKGLIVSQNVSEPLKNFIDLFLARQTSVGHMHLFEVRNLLEVEIAGLAAERATSEQISSLEQILAELSRLDQKPGPWLEEDTVQFQKLDFRFHLTVAECTKNELFVLLLSALHDAFMISWAGMCRRAEVRRHGIETHERIFVTIRAKDASGARRATREILRTFLADVNEANNSNEAELTSDRTDHQA